MSKLVTYYENIEDYNKNIYDNQLDIVNSIISNLTIKPRHYQIKALNRMIHYYENHIDKDFNIHLLFQLATGSGKTLLMAMMMLYLRSQGYSTFIFLVSSTAIIDKTKLNFTTLNSNKSLFKSTINLDGKSLFIKEVNSPTIDNNINVYYTTVQALHIALSNPSENNLDINDFKSLKSPIVLLGDEAHHFNTSTKKDSENETWEDTISKILSSKTGNILIEMTATPEVDVKSVSDKYEDKLITSYSLSEFTKDRYAKNILVNHISNFTTQDKMLSSILFSQYRKHIASTMNIILKPVILFKSADIKTSEVNYNDFIELINNLNINQLENMTNLLDKSGLKDYYPNIHTDFINYLRKSPNKLLADLQLDFNSHNIININDNKELENNSVKINTLESVNNPYRVVFEVKKLDEGWDVLNLFDIVKLFTTKNKSQNTQEIQLIGRGARYNPFIDNSIPFDEQDKYKQKYNISEDNPRLLLESLIFHSDDTPEFISNLSETLKNMGHTIITQYKTTTMNLKQSFIDDIGYTTKGIYLNSKKDIVNIIEGVGVTSYKTKNKVNNKEYVKLSPSTVMNTELEYNLDSQSTMTVLDSNISQSNSHTRYKFTDLIPYHVFIKACNRVSPIISTEYLLTVCETPTRQSLYDDILQHTTIKVVSQDKDSLDKNKIYGEIKLKIAIKTLNHFLSSINKMVVSKNGEHGTTEFTMIPIKDLLPTSQDIRVKHNALEVTSDILAQDIIYCDSSYEVDFVKFIEDTIKGDLDFDKKFKYFYLVRNNLYFKLFDLVNGNVFYPDFVILAERVDKKDYQLFSEVKGEHLEQLDKWKEDTLVSINSQVDGTMLVGLKFYNKGNKVEYLEMIKNILIG